MRIEKYFEYTRLDLEKRMCFGLVQKYLLQDKSKIK